jgi:hypothetical protein
MEVVQKILQESMRINAQNALSTWFETKLGKPVDDIETTMIDNNNRVVQKYVFARAFSMWLCVFIVAFLFLSSSFSFTFSLIGAGGASVYYMRNYRPMTVAILVRADSTMKTTTDAVQEAIADTEEDRQNDLQKKHA